jgi:hypothetical protein
MRSRTGPLARDAAPDKIKIGPLCRWVLPVSELAAWLDGAAPGERVAYARGLALAAGSASAHLARDWAAGGLVHLFQVPVPLDGGGREFEFMVERRHAVRGEPQAPSGQRGITAAGVVDDDALPPGDEGRVLVLLRRAARFGQQCPTNAEIAEALGLRNHEAARYLIGKLIRAELIRVTDHGPAHRRVVRILPDGPATVAGRL